MNPIKRSKIRIMLGRIYYKLRRYIEWYLGEKRYAKKSSNTLLPMTVFKHQTPMLRKLKNVDMWMQHNKINNLKVAIQSLNSILIYPGETFSYWRLLGKPTKRKGYLEGMVLSHGSVKSGVGGGLCQLSNLIYWMTLHTPLTVVERYRHSYDVFPDSNRLLPFGSGATCSYNYIDLQIYNGTEQPYQLNLYLDEKYLVGEWRANEALDYEYEVYEEKHWITHEPWGGYVRHNILRKRTLKVKEIINDEYVTENHAVMMYQPFLNEGFQTNSR